VLLTVAPDPRDERIEELEDQVEDTQRRLQETQAQLIAELEKELQTAHEMQMALMPQHSPQIEGLEIAGRCIPANHGGLLLRWNY